MIEEAEISEAEKKIRQDKRLKIIRSLLIQDENLKTRLIEFFCKDRETFDSVIETVNDSKEANQGLKPTND